ncbi:hypothetical protein JT358_09920 [Micrococcales bacterium 31B]|nr:hypothetical protein [Micrococcales bacterium 31B]
MTAATAYARPRALRNALAAAVVVACLAVLAVQVSGFFSAAYLGGILGAAAVVGLLAAGATVCAMAGSLDLSAPAAMTVAAAAGALVAQSAGGVLGAVTALAVGLALGVVSGLVVASVRASTVVVSLLLAVVYESGASALLGGAPLDLAPAIRSALSGVLPSGAAPVSGAALLMLAVMTILGLLLWRSGFGRRVLAVGGHREAARLGGIRVGRVQVAALAVNGACAGLAAVVALGDAGAATPGMGASAGVLALAAVALGGTSLLGGRGAMWRTLLGTLAVTLCGMTCSALGGSMALVPLVVGALAVLAVGLDARASARR